MDAIFPEVEIKEVTNFQKNIKEHMDIENLPKEPLVDTKMGYAVAIIDLKIFAFLFSFLVIAILYYYFFLQ